MLLEEAHAAGMVERCARDLLVRSLRERLIEGWQREWGPDIPGDTTTLRWRSSTAVGYWSADLAWLAEYAEPARQVQRALKEASFPLGWLPVNADEPLLVDVFCKNWKEPN